MAYRIENGPLRQLLWAFADNVYELWKADGFEQYPDWKIKNWGITNWSYEGAPNGFRATINIADKCGECSSLHYHPYADNYFIVHTGCVVVTTVWDDGREQIEFIGDGQVFCVPRGQRHKFAVVESSIFSEIYLAQPGSPIGEDDIVRE